MATVFSPESSSSLQVARHYPLELVGSEEIHQFIPHLPVLVSRNNPDTVSIPFGDYEGTFDKLGILVDQSDRDVYNLSLFNDKDVPFPNHLDGRFTLESEVGRFVLHANERRSRQITAFSPDGEQVRLRGKYSKLLSPYLLGAVEVARIKNARYNQNR